MERNVAPSTCRRPRNLGRERQIVDSARDSDEVGVGDPTRLLLKPCRERVDANEPHATRHDALVEGAGDHDDGVDVDDRPELRVQSLTDAAGRAAYRRNKVRQRVVVDRRLRKPHVRQPVLDDDRPGYVLRVEQEHAAHADDDVVKVPPAAVGEVVADVPALLLQRPQRLPGLPLPLRAPLPTRDHLGRLVAEDACCR